MQEVDWNALNPIALWRDWIAKSEAQWSEALSKVLKDECTAAALNRQLAELRLLQGLFAEMAHASLAAANLPSRSDFEALDERLGRVEDGLAQVSAQVAQLRAALAASGLGGAVGREPRRDRQPAAAAGRSRSRA